MSCNNHRELEALASKIAPRQETGGNGHGVEWVEGGHPIGTSTTIHIIEEGLEALAEAPPITPQPVRLRPLRREDKIVALQRRWHLTYPDTPTPESIEDLLCLIPSGLSRAEVKLWIHGALEEAKTIFLKTFNTSWTKTEFYRRIADNGVSNALSLFNPNTRRDISAAIRMLTD